MGTTRIQTCDLLFYNVSFLTYHTPNSANLTTFLQGPILKAIKVINLPILKISIHILNTCL